MKNRIVIISIIISAALLPVILFTSGVLNVLVFRSVVYIKLHFTSGNMVEGKDGWFFYKPELDYVLRKIPDKNIEGIAAFSRTLQQNKITLFVAPIPNKIDIYPDKFTNVKTSHPVKPQLTDLLRKLEKEGVRTIDLRPALEQEKRSHEVFGPYDTHWNPEGIEISARVIAERIRPVMDSLGVRHKIRFETEDTSYLVNAFGNLAFNGKLPEYRLHVKQVLYSGGQPFTDDKEAKILILGDSFVDHCRWWNANLGAHIARVAGTPTRTWFSLLANTDGPCMYKNKPGMFPRNGIVIWAFTARVLRHHLRTPGNSDLTDSPEINDF